MIENVPSRIGLFLVPGFSLMALSAASEPLRAANRMASRTLYTWRLVGVTGAPVTSSSGFALMPHAVIAGPEEFDAVVVVSSLEVAGFRRNDVFEWLRALNFRGCHLGAVSTGSFVLARAGLLDGYRFTVHWELVADFAEEFPALEPSRDLYVIDRNRFTCGGGTAGLDLMLAMIERRHGHDLAVAVAEQFLHTRIRQPDEGQRMDIAARYGVNDARLARAVALMEVHVERPLPTEAVALRVGVSSRQLERLFMAAFGTTPAKFHLDLRLRLARRLLVESTQPLVQIALQCGFSSASHFGHAYREAFNETPARARKTRDGIVSDS